MDLAPHRSTRLIRRQRKPHKQRLSYYVGLFVLSCLVHFAYLQETAAQTVGSRNSVNSSRAEDTVVNRKSRRKHVSADLPRISTGSESPAKKSTVSSLSSSKEDYGKDSGKQIEGVSFCDLTKTPERYVNKTVITSAIFLTSFPDVWFMYDANCSEMSNRVIDYLNCKSDAECDRLKKLSNSHKDIEGDMRRNQKLVVGNLHIVPSRDRSQPHAKDLKFEILDIIAVAAVPEGIPWPWTPQIQNNLLTPLGLSRELRDRLVQRFDLFIAYEKAQAYESQYDLLAKDHLADLLHITPTKENYVTLKKEMEIAGKLLRVSVNRIERRPGPSPSLNFSATVELRKGDRTYLDSPILVAYLINGDWYFSILYVN